MRNVLVVAQVATFASLGILLIAQRELRLGLAQLLLGVITVLIYSA